MRKIGEQVTSAIRSGKSGHPADTRKPPGWRGLACWCKWLRLQKEWLRGRATTYTEHQCLGSAGAIARCTCHKRTVRGRRNKPRLAAVDDRFRPQSGHSGDGNRRPLMTHCGHPTCNQYHVRYSRDARAILHLWCRQFRREIFNYANNRRFFTVKKRQIRCTTKHTMRRSRIKN